LGPWRVVSSELEHAADVLDVLLADLVGRLVGLRVVVAVGQPQTALCGSRDDFGRVFAVLLGAELEERIDAAKLLAGDLGLERRERLDRIDAIDFGPQRLDAGGLDRRLVHAGAVEIAELPSVRAGRGPLVRRGVLEDRAQRLAVALLDLIERPPRGVLRRYGVLLQPAADRVLVEVCARGI